MTSTTQASPETRWLDDGQQAIWRSFLGGSTVFFDQLDRDLRREHDLSMPEYEILVRLSEADDWTLRMAQLADQVSHSRSRVTHTVARLERAGLVVRRSCVSDGRGVNAQLTEAGMERLREAAHTHVGGVRRYLLDNATDEEFEVIGRVFERIRNDLGGARF
ncbi:MarR family transcriptional regulator [Mumia sp. zg.B53]|uniref:MarR family winged helix-turn-helix transcriptional regulator n=1 Tax=unclassified Mumia TaxID=2621872 RepID=UPI001C6EEC17|nr:MULTISPECIES: MarR family transcriptional regulator [unclassified Mumia]MBW9205712.1 MarR family transcriptional regulator [Mumia sp. zg.B17]MBW9208287.1 MarR family transcriptional regulator [Mumia sp. zg.B21]MBW9216244.1 MarR family transcriptional regulator [Mumia sp. zg.B53]MDD9348754.1 MarR family transcriptional regulator [Mumia sp.]